MCERVYRHTTNTDDGFTLIETLVAFLVATLVLTAFAGFYVATQRGIRRQQVEIASSEGLRVALEEMARDLRSSGLDPAVTAVTADSSSKAGSGITSADVREVDFTLDADASGAVSSTDPLETKKFRQSGTELQSYQAGTTGSWITLADSIATAGTAGAIFRYYKCDGTEVTSLPASGTTAAAIARVDLSLTVTGTGGTSFSRTETGSIRLRNKGCS